MPDAVLRTTVVERADIEVIYVGAADEASAIRAAWDRLESVVPLSGRRFYGAFYPATLEYRACVEVVAGDDADALGLASATLPGGRYLRARLSGEPPGVYERIGPTFDAMAKEAAADPVRPSIEFYRRHDEIELLLPLGPTG